MFEKPTLMSFAPKRYQAPAQHVQAELAGLRVVADNAKAEGIEGKPAFREAFQRRRCLVPVG
jgi:putative SOS response-associated peptidase YedK